MLLCGVYARREATYGNIDHARKVFDMALASVESLPMVCYRICKCKMLTFHARVSEVSLLSLLLLKKKKNNLQLHHLQVNFSFKGKTCVISILEWPCTLTFVISIPSKFLFK